MYSDFTLVCTRGLQINLMFTLTLHLWIFLVDKILENSLECPLNFPEPEVTVSNAFIWYKTKGDT